MRHDKVTLWDRLTYHNRFTDKLMQMSGMRNWRRDKRQMIPFAVSVRSSAYLGVLTAVSVVISTGLIFLFSGLPSIGISLFLMQGVLGFVLTFILQFISNCWWNARAMKLNVQQFNRSKSPTTPSEFLGELPEILR